MSTCRGNLAPTNGQENKTKLMRHRTIDDSDLCVRHRQGYRRKRDKRRRNVYAAAFPTLRRC